MTEADLVERAQAHYAAHGLRTAREIPVNGFFIDLSVESLNGDLWAIEAKLSNIPRLLFQAARRKKATPVVYALVPASEDNATTRKRASKIGVGLIVYDGAEFTEAIAPKRAVRVSTQYSRTYRERFNASQPE